MHDIKAKTQKLNNKKTKPINTAVTYSGRERAFVLHAGDCGSIQSLAGADLSHLYR